jgi:hypothetical protein
LTREHVIEWLMLRERRWPRTANPYVLVNKHTALGLGHINQSIVTTIFAGLPNTASDLRTDTTASDRDHANAPEDRLNSRSDRALSPPRG